MSAVATLYKKYLITRSVTIDSRQVVPGSLFFAIRGVRFNGNGFAEEALAKGASYAIIDDPVYLKASSAYILVTDARAALQQLAAYHRAQYNAHFSVIGITGSYGKTTTKELIYSVLRTSYRTVATKDNLNTSVGLALTLLSMDQDTEIAIVEMGAKQVGDIALCCEMAQPTHGIITAIGEVHLDGFALVDGIKKGFGNLEGVLRGKGELYDYLYARGGIVFLNTLEPSLPTIGQRFVNPITYPQPADFAPLDLIAETPYLCYRSPEGKEVTTHLLGKPNIYNIAAALCVAKYFQLPMEVAHQAIQEYLPVNQRMELVVKGTNQIIVDSYNASPASVQAALDSLLQLKVSYRVVILSDMAELGNRTTYWHQKIFEQLSQPSYDLVLLYGMIFTDMANKQADIKIHCFTHKEALMHYLTNQHFQHSGILLKGSRRSNMHTLMEAII